MCINDGILMSTSLWAFLGGTCLSVVKTSRSNIILTVFTMCSKVPHSTFTGRVVIDLVHTVTTIVTWVWVTQI